ncbi:MAG: SufD family Fe-S cluster assembly protein, partial [Pseudomonadota bacterium]
MAIAIAKTPTETHLAGALSGLADTLPGGEPALSARRAALAAFTELGLPHRRVEEWKYTDLRQVLKEIGALDAARGGADGAALEAALGPLAGLENAVRLVIVDGHYDAAASTDGMPAGVSFITLADALNSNGDALSGWASVPEPVETGVLKLNTAYVTDGVCLRIEGGATIDRPLVIVHARSAGAPLMTTTRNVVEVGAGASVTLVEAFVGLGAATGGEGNAATRISVGDKAEVHHVKVAVEPGVRHVGNWAAKLGAETIYRPFFFTAGPALARNNLHVEFAGDGAKLNASGAFLGRDRQHIDNTLWIDHNVPGCESRELFKGVLDDHARGIFQGKVVVQPVAQKTDGKQMAQALMLSPTCEFDSKPELEIYADDV